jgi:hypothetical protein
MANQTKNDGLWVAMVMVIAAALIAWLMYSGFFVKVSPVNRDEAPAVKTILQPQN